MVRPQKEKIITASRAFTCKPRRSRMPLFTPLAWGVLFACLTFVNVHAQTLVVESVVSPAWVERGGTREPLQPGAVLRAKDKVHTGASARLLLRLAEGSAVKLGEHATLAV